MTVRARPKAGWKATTAGWVVVLAVTAMIFAACGHDTKSSAPASSSPAQGREPERRRLPEHQHDDARRRPLRHQRPGSSCGSARGRQLSERRRLSGGHDHPTRPAGGDGQARRRVQSGERRLGVLLPRRVADRDEDPGPGRRRSAEPVRRKLARAVTARPNRSSTSCAARTTAARPSPIGPDVIAALQKADPRPT